MTEDDARTMRRIIRQMSDQEMLEALKEALSKDVSIEALVMASLQELAKDGHREGRSARQG